MLPSRIVLTYLRSAIFQDLGVFTLGRGEVMAAACAVAAAVATIISKVQLTQVSLGIFTIARLVVGTVVFFSIAMYLFGPHHFMDAFSPFFVENYVNL